MPRPFGTKTRLVSRVGKWVRLPPYSSRASSHPIFLGLGGLAGKLALGALPTSLKASREFLVSDTEF
jgi:hypothetical protein